MSRLPITSRLLLFFVAAWMLLHWPLLGLPYHWDEAGYFVPAAYDIFRTGELVFHSEPSNAHPPLVMALVALSWKVFGFSSTAARAPVLFLGALALWGLYRIAARLVNGQVALASVICTALYPVFFVQSALVHLDIAATAFTLWGLAFYFDRRLWASAAMFSLAALAKETAILTPVVLLMWESVAYLTQRRRRSDFCAHVFWRRRVALLVTPGLSLGLWFGYHFIKTGSAFGNAQFLDYNVITTMNPARMLVVLPLRLWHASAYMNLFVLSLLSVAATLWAAPLREGREERQGMSARALRVLLLLILAHVVAFSLVGGAILPRYMLPVVPLVILICVSALWRRLRPWSLAVGLTCLAFVYGLFVSPTYQFDRGDNLAYRKFALLQRDAARFVSEHFPQAVVSTAWPVTEGLRKPYLGYAVRPVSVAPMQNFSRPSLVATRHSGSDLAIVFPRKQQSEWGADRPLHRFAAVEYIQRRFFEPVEDVSLDGAIQLLGGRILWREEDGGVWVAVLRLNTQGVR